MDERASSIGDCFIVRFYRQDDRSDDAVAGMVEKVGAAGRKPFKNKEELWRILQPRPKKKCK